MSVRILTGDCREIMPSEGPFDLIVADPPYGDTSLEWDRRVDGWLALARESLLPSGSMWVFGSVRFFMDHGEAFRAAGLRYAQDIIWEKQNGTGFSSDRFKRVHELIVQFYRSDARWSDVYNDVQKVKYIGPDKHIRARRGRTPHTGQIGAYEYDGNVPRIMRSVLAMKNMHGRAIHPTEKPAPLLEILIKTSCPPHGLVGDWFAGSGAAGEATIMTGRHYLGCEIDADMARKARDRLGTCLFGSVAE